MSDQKSANLLDHFYEHLSEDEWLDGVDLYQSGRVRDLQAYNNLLYAKVNSPTRPQEEVRIKIHPGGHCIQWMECTCGLNRRLGHYCKHIAALMLHIDRERSDLFANLDINMPLKPPLHKRAKKEAFAAPLKNKGETASTGAILDHLKGQIHSVSLLTHGPSIRVRIEIKEGHVTHYDLDLDSAAKFLEANDVSKCGTAEVKRLRVYKEKVQLGTRIYQHEDDDEKIIAERVVALPLNSLEPPEYGERIKFSHTVGEFKRHSLKERKNEEKRVDEDLDPYLFIPIKTASKYIGQDHFFMPAIGYWRLDKREKESSWDDLPLTKTFKEDNAAKLISEDFTDYITSAPIFLDKHLNKPLMFDAPELLEIRIISEEDGWFHLDPRYGEGEGSVSMIELMSQYKKKKRKYLRSKKGWMKIPEFVTEHDWFVEEDGSAIKVDALGLLRLRAAVGDFDKFVGSKQALAHIRKNLEFSEDIEVPSLDHTQLDLRKYQTSGLKWLWWLFKNNLHGLLADEMGLGKTHQAMALMSAMQRIEEKPKFLVICPTTVLDHWMDKIEEFSPNLRPIKYHGLKRGPILDKLDSENDTLVTSYGILLRDIKKLSEQRWNCVTLDEAHFVKNNDTATYRAACRLNSRLRVCMTGTPMENHLGELKNIYDFLIPGYLGSNDYFRKNFLQPIESKEDPQSEVGLQKLIYPFKMRRTKNLVLPDLPPKVEDTRNCTLSAEQIKLYRSVVELKANPLIKQLADNDSPVPYMHVFATLTLLKQICNHPALMLGTDYHQHESGKFNLLVDILRDALGSGHKIVIFSQYLGMIDILDSHLTENGVEHVVLTGQSRKRGEIIKKFQEDPETKVFLGSLMAGGIGIDLTAASVVIHYDRWWNASKENQATDRVHRIGQNKNVQVLKFVTKGTLEEKIDEMIKRKQALFEKFLDQDEKLFESLTRQELIELLQ